MSEFFFGGSAGLFTAAALIGTLFFLIRLGLMLTAGSDMSDVDHGGDLHVDADHPDSTQAFKVLSIQTVSAFLMGFGWGGLGALRGAGWSITTSLTFGLAVGGGMVWLLGKLLELMTHLQSSGNIRTEQALDREGTVYASIPAVGHGRGQVRIVIDDRERFYYAVSDDDALDTSTRVRVVRVNDDNSVTVSRA
jgi:membrane protein implicated in regulation of membrane protease activity